MGSAHAVDAGAGVGWELSSMPATPRAREEDREVQTSDETEASGAPELVATLRHTRARTFWALRAPRPAGLGWLCGLVQPRLNWPMQFAFEMMELGADFLNANCTTHEDVSAKFSDSYSSFTA